MCITYVPTSLFLWSKFRERFAFSLGEVLGGGGAFFLAGFSTSFALALLRLRWFITANFV